MYVEKWKLGLVDGNRGINTRNLSRHIVKYLYNKYNTKCSLCGWDKQNPFSNLPVLEVDHIDGNSENNSENNLRLLCPNCHSLTENYKNLNSKQGRSWRKAKYLKNMPR